MDYEDDFLFEEDKIPDVELVEQDQSAYLSQQHIYQMGMTISSGNVVIKKDSSNLIGISIGGGAPLCPCLYIVQVFDNTPAAQDGTLEAGDELVAVNGEYLKGKTKVEVAKMIQACDTKVSIIYNKLHADVRQGRTLDIILKKVKHRLVESMGNTTADALGLSRAILCNDTLVQRLAALEKTENLYKGLVSHVNSVLHAFFDLFQIYKVFGDAFASMGVKEPQPRASEAFTSFGEQHRQMEKLGIAMLKTVKPIMSDLGTYLNKAIPDTRMTISKYADCKFEYLSYCLKVKEMDDEEQSYVAIQEPLYRIETGNYEYRLILRCRQNARSKFARLRSDVLVKLELLDNKHVEDLVKQIQKLSNGLANYYTDVTKLLAENVLFPVEIDLSQNAFQYQQPWEIPAYNDEEDDDEVDADVDVVENVEEVRRAHGPKDNRNEEVVDVVEVGEVGEVGEVEEVKGACGFDQGKMLDLEVAEEAIASPCGEWGSRAAAPTLSKDLYSNLEDLVNLATGFTKMDQQFEQLLLLDEQPKSTEPMAEPASLQPTYAKADEDDKAPSLLLLDTEETTKATGRPASVAPLQQQQQQQQQQQELFTLESSRLTTEAMSFLDIPNEPLLNIQTN